MLENGLGFEVDVTVGRLVVYSHQRSDKDQLKGTTKINRQRTLDYTQLQVQVLHETHTTGDDIQHSISISGKCYFSTNATSTAASKNTMY